jgi:hypothetical protein
MSMFEASLGLYSVTFPLHYFPRAQRSSPVSLERAFLSPCRSSLVYIVSILVSMSIFYVSGGDLLMTYIKVTQTLEITFMFAKSILKS